jgi:hypothetical protein
VGDSEADVSGRFIGESEERSGERRVALRVCRVDNDPLGARKDGNVSLFLVHLATLESPRSRCVVDLLVYPDAVRALCRLPPYTQALGTVEIAFPSGQLLEKLHLPAEAP